MRRNIKYIAIILFFIVLVTILVIVNNSKNKEDDGKFKIVTSFYPIYIMAVNITEGAENIDLVNMSETNIGCIHDYTLTTEDMKKIEKANVFIQNGLGIESFMDKITDSNKKIKIINSSDNIKNLLEKQEKVNPHIWTSISNYIEQVKNITEGLKQANPENKEIYEKNSNEYIERLAKIKLRYNTKLQQLKGKSAVSLNDSFEYLGRNLGLELNTIYTSHEDSTMSAETLKNLIETMKQNNTRIIIVDVNDNLKNAQTIANETGAQIYKLNSGVTGGLSKDAYINCLNSNLEVLSNME